MVGELYYILTKGRGRSLCIWMADFFSLGFFAVLRHYIKMYGSDNHGKNGCAYAVRKTVILHLFSSASIVFFANFY